MHTYVCLFKQTFVYINMRKSMCVHICKQKMNHQQIAKPKGIENKHEHTKAVLLIINDNQKTPTTNHKNEQINQEQHIHTYIHTYIHMCIYMYIYIYLSIYLYAIYRYKVHKLPRRPIHAETNQTNGWIAFKKYEKQSVPTQV